MAKSIIQDDHGREDESYEYFKIAENDDETEIAEILQKKVETQKKYKKSKNKRKPKTIFVGSTTTRSSTP
jgi:hypothetical protein